MISLAIGQWYLVEVHSIEHCVRSSGNGVSLMTFRGTIAYVVVVQSAYNDV